MKKTTDIFLRIIIVGVILGAIGFYYFKKFTKPVAPVLKSEIIKLPEKVEIIQKKVKIEKKVVTKSTNEDNNSLNQVKKDNNTNVKKTAITIEKNYTINVERILSERKLNELVKFLKQVPDVTFKTSFQRKKVEFKRVLIGPYLRKINVIKMEAKIRDMQIRDYLRLKLKNGYYLHVGSFADKSRLEAFVTLLRKNRIYNIKYMVVKVPKKVYSVKIIVHSDKTLNQIKSFLNAESLHYHYKTMQKSNGQNNS